VSVGTSVPIITQALLERLEHYRLDVSRSLDSERRAALGQFLTPAPIALRMAALLAAPQRHIRLLDPGAGIGSLTAAVVAALCARPDRPEALAVMAYEIDPLLAGYLRATLDACRVACELVGIAFAAEVCGEDFIVAGARAIAERGTFFAADLPPPTVAILNPPYRKIHSQSRERALLSSVGIETSNLYTGFMSIALRLLADGGELVAITPRSFCNGPYFQPFRLELLQTTTLQHIHVFESRSETFRDDEVLQENIILHAVRAAPPGRRTVARPRASVVITSSAGADDAMVERRVADYTDVVRPSDPAAFIRIVPNEVAASVVRHIDHFTASLADLGLSVSTGRVVDFRAADSLRAAPEPGTCPLIYPMHLGDGGVHWPKQGSKKPNAIVHAPATAHLLVPNEIYVLTKRFSAKEERRRLVAAVYSPERLPGVEHVGFENHLNYYHREGRGLPAPLAKGLALYLNSTLVDEYFRQFSGHTQVNATDLRALRYPPQAVLEALGSRVGDVWPTQAEIDDLLHAEGARMAADQSGLDPIAVKRRMEEALDVLRALGLPRAQQNDRSALALLALLDLTPDKNCSDWSRR
jgi:adenine-specific DNA-methyltransferase